MPGLGNTDVVDLVTLDASDGGHTLIMVHSDKRAYTEPEYGAMGNQSDTYLQSLVGRESSWTSFAALP